MISVKQRIAVFLCCVLLLPHTAQAQWPVFDFMESVPLFKQLTSTTESLKNVTSQVSELKKTLEAIGNKVSSITKFAQDLTNLNKKIVKLERQVKKTIDEATSISSSLEKSVNEAIDAVTKGQQELVNQTVEQTNNTLENSVSEEETPIKSANEGENTTENNTADKTPVKVDIADESITNKGLEDSVSRKSNITDEDITNKNIKDDLAIKNGIKELPKIKIKTKHFLPKIEEEEEEEEINEDKENILSALAIYKAGSEQLTKELNDVITDAIYVLNKSAEISHQRLLDLQSILENKELKVDETQRESAQKKLKELIAEEQRVSDLGADIAENAKNEYNKEYQRKIADGYSNYEKAILAYYNNNATRDEVKEMGSRLKEQVATINTVLDKSTLENYEKELQMVRDKTSELSSDIQKMVEEEKEVSL